MPTQGSGHATSRLALGRNGVRELMAKRKSIAVAFEADGAGGMRAIEDRRFESGAWPISRRVPMPGSETWMQYLSAECGRRGFACSTFGQIDVVENSGTVTINTGKAMEAPLHLIWERRQGGPLTVRGR